MFYLSLSDALKGLGNWNGKTNRVFCAPQPASFYRPGYPIPQPGKLFLLGEVFREKPFGNILPNEEAAVVIPSKARFQFGKHTRLDKRIWTLA